PGSPLFPYTTLFRSVMTFADVYSSLNELLKSGNREAKTATRKIISQYDTAALLDIKAELMAVPDCQKLFGEVLKLFDEQIGAALDRKSTRLNSSHVS